jgi:DNA-binding response OmpR family regulator
MPKATHILVIDDEPLLRETLFQVLTEEGYQVQVANNGLAGLQQADAQRPDLVLLDLMMPGMNGRQFLTTFRKDLRFSDIPIVIMTAVHGLNINVSSMGRVEILEKPFEAEELLKRIALAVFRTEDSELLVEVFGNAANTSVDDGSQVILLIDPNEQSNSYLEKVLAAQTSKVIAMRKPTFEINRLIRAMSPVAVVIAAASEAVESLSLPASCPVIIVDDNVSQEVRSAAVAPRVSCTTAEVAKTLGILLAR